MVTANVLDSIPQTPGYPFLKTNEKVQVPKDVTDFVDYKAEKAKADRRKKLTQGKSKKSLGPELEELLKQETPLLNWRLLQVLNTLQGDETSNRIHALIQSMTPSDFSQQVKAGLDALRSFEPSGLDWPASSVQLFSPNAAKGYSRLKPDSTERNDKTKEQWTDPFVEWLRYRGYFAVACPFFDGPKAENVRLLCPVPADISVGALKEICGALRQAGVFGGPPKLDSLATLKLAELLITRSQEYAGANPIAGLFLLGKRPSEVISGISVTQYQSLGNAKAVSSIATLALPGWLAINSRDDALAFLSILEEHQRVVRSLEDNHSDEIGLLIQYRRFLELRGEGSIRALIDLMARYGALVLRAREQGRRVAQFSTQNFGRLLMQNAQRLGDVLNDTGFQAVAAAIRSATVSAQAQKAMNRPDYREIRYDLLPELRRKSSLPGNPPLVQAISEFISKYNSENARRRELNKSAPRNVTTEEFSSLVTLIDTHHAATVGPMLCAYGSCRVSRDSDSEDNHDLNQTETD
ncbi:MAG: hypothetical protein IVW54_03530 [Candidatus Binataceae bacterium]|nr:hypothetical protein [Candidatus Binataceae bacterium]